MEGPSKEMSLVLMPETSHYLLSREKEQEDKKRRQDVAFGEFENLINQPWVNLTILQKHRKRLQEERKMMELALMKVTSKYCDWFISTYHDVIAVTELRLCKCLSQETNDLYLTMLRDSISSDQETEQELCKKQENMEAEIESTSTNNDHCDDDYDEDVVDACDVDSSDDMDPFDLMYEVSLPEKVSQFLNERSSQLHYLLEQVVENEDKVDTNKLICLFFTNLTATSRKFGVALDMESIMKIPTTGDPSYSELPSGNGLRSNGSRSTLLGTKLWSPSLHFPPAYPLACLVVWMKREMINFLEILGRIVLWVPEKVREESFAMVRSRTKELTESIGLDLFFLVDQYLQDLLSTLPHKNDDE